ncbi:MAG: hypothetical protein ABIP29_07300 [Candidatus Eisenbacteria bacterium]
MSTKTDYTDEEWTLLLKTPALAGIAVVTVSPSGPIGVFKELSSMGKWILGAGENAPAGTLVAVIVEDIRAIAERKQPAPPDEKIPPAELKTRVLANLKQAVEILSAKATPTETEAYKQWILDVAANIAKAAKEGTVFGFGGTLVSDAERGVLREIAEALGTTAPTL